MNNIEKQILKNQDMIMTYLNATLKTIVPIESCLGDCIEETRELLRPKDQDEECSDGLPKQFAFSSQKDKMGEKFK